MNRLLLLSPFLVLSLISFAQTKPQDLLINPATGLVSILDSIKVGDNYSPLWAKKLVGKWANYSAYDNPTVKVFGYIPTDKEVILGFNALYNTGTQWGKYFLDGQLKYFAKNKRGNVDSGDKTNGDVTFRVNFEVKGQYIILELTHFFYGDSKNEIGKFEDPHLLSSDGVTHLSEKQKPWNRIKHEYFDRLAIIFRNLKEFIATHYRNP